MKNTTSVQFADNILSSDYNKNLSEFKNVVKREFDGTIFENSGLPKFSDRNAEPAWIKKADSEMTGASPNGDVTTPTESAYEDNISNPKQTVKRSDRYTEPVSNRDILTNALESAAQNGIERKKIRE